MLISKTRAAIIALAAWATVAAGSIGPAVADAAVAGVVYRYWHHH